MKVLDDASHPVTDLANGVVIVRCTCHDEAEDLICEVTVLLAARCLPTAT
jgi:hypothetical protein